jgi:hypothetical protein
MEKKPTRKDHRVYSGFLWKRAIKSGRNWKRRFFVLYPDRIAYFTHAEATKPKGARRYTIGTDPFHRIHAPSRVAPSPRMSRFNTNLLLFFEGTIEFTLDTRVKEGKIGEMG